MKNSIPPQNTSGSHSDRRSFHPGMSLLELTVVIVVMLSLISLLFFAAGAWRRESNRTTCIMTIQIVQKGLRSHCNLHGLEPNTNVPGLKNFIIGSGRFVETTPICPSGGVYTYGEDTIPPTGTLYMECSLSATDRHEPVNFNDW